MILTLISILMFLIGIILFIIGNNTGRYDLYLDVWGLITMLFGGIFAFICISIVIESHIHTVPKIQEIEYKQNCLIEQNNALKECEEEELDKTIVIYYNQVILNIAEWNGEVAKEKYWAYNPWTSWFYDKRVVDTMVLIE